MTTSPFSGQVLNAPFTAFQIELMCNALELYKSSGYNSKDLEYLEQQLVLYRSMLLEKHKRILEESLVKSHTKAENNINANPR